MERGHAALRDTAVECVLQAGDWLRQQFGERIVTRPKSDDSVVTELDLESERLISRILRDRYPDHTIIGEEATPHEAVGECIWAVDPIDGTRNFANGIPLWAVSVAALEHGRPVSAAIYLPVTGELYHAAAGLGAWLHDRRLSVGDTAELSEAIVMTDLLPRVYPEHLPGTRLGGLITAARRTRMLGSVCCAMAYVAAGRFDLYYRPQVSLWDVAAGVLLVREAGGEVRDFGGGEWSPEATSILAANPALVEHFLSAKRTLEQSG